MLLNPDSNNFLPNAAGNINNLANIAQLMQQMQMMQADPFERRSKADLLLGQSEPQNFLPSQVPAPDINSLVEAIPPTDFYGASPGLPNLRDDYSGFGYGQNAPKVVNQGQDFSYAQNQMGMQGGQDGMQNILAMLAERGLI